MWMEAVDAAVLGFSVVFITLIILCVSIKFMSFCCKKIDKTGGKS